MKNLVSRLTRKVGPLRDIPEIQLLLAGLSLSLMWEVLQSPFYTDTFAVSWATLVYNRLHCTGGDAVILLVAFWLVALRWGRSWMRAASWAPCTAFLALGVAYTVFSEHYNVHLVQRWAYSRWMPTIAGVGLIPPLQWVVVPTLCVHLVRSYSRWQHWKTVRQVTSGVSPYVSGGEQI